MEPSYRKAPAARTVEALGFVTDYQDGHAMKTTTQSADSKPFSNIEPTDSGWLHYAARVRTIEIDGVNCIYHERLTPDFTTAQAAWIAAEEIEGDDIVVCGYDQDRNGCAHDEGK